MDIPKSIVYVDSTINLDTLVSRYPSVDFKLSSENSDLGFCLSEKKGRIGVLTLDEKALFLNIDFNSGELRRRRKFLTPKKEPLLKAIGKLNQDEFIVDGTAGLGRESFLLMSYGYNVRAVEQSAYLWILQQEALRNIVEDKNIPPEKQRLHFFCGDSTELIAKENWSPAILYLDPMFPASKKTAQVKKPMQVLQKMELKNVAPEELLKKALTLKVGKIVFKRPKDAPILDTVACREYYENDTVRFEIYEPH